MKIALNENLETNNEVPLKAFKNIRFKNFIFISLYLRYCVCFSRFFWGGGLLFFFYLRLKTIIFHSSAHELHERITPEVE